MKNLYINQFNPAGERCLLPLAAGILAACVREDPVLKGHYRTSINFLRQEPAKVVSELIDPVVLAFSGYVWNIRQSLLVAKQAKERFPHCVIIFGGPSIPRYETDIGHFLSQHEFIDILAHGEGEITLVEILRALLEGSDLNNVKGISFRSKESPSGYIKTTPRERITDLNLVPSPFLTGIFDEILARHREQITGTIWETNRGCPFACTFCDWGQVTQSRVIIHTEERLVREMDWMSKNEIPYIFATDANFGIKERDLKIAEYLGHLHKTTGSPRYILINWMKNSRKKTIDIADALRRNGMGFMVTLSMQSFDEDTLEAIKRTNIDLETFASLKKEYNERGIETYSELLLGLPGETYESFTNGLMKVLSPLPTDHFALYLTNALPNSEMAEPEYREQYGIETRFTKSTVLRQRTVNRDVYEVDETIVGTRSMPVPDWCRAFCFGYLLKALHNMKVAFYTIEFLREHYAITPKSFIEYLIQAGRTPGRAPMMAKLLKELDRNTDSILRGDDNMLSFEGYPEYHWEPHEICFLAAYHGEEDFHRELKNLTVEFVVEKGHGDEVPLVREVCSYQEAVSPLNKSRVPFHVEFEYNLLEYFNALLKNKNGVEILKEPCILEFESSYKEERKGNDINYLLAVVRAHASGLNSYCRVKEIPWFKFKKEADPHVAGLE
ncbi:MAG: radical SAM protein [Deltaproteobacteria bacterium]|nr:radical SAM protein [Deltaproteobacteria bacterium]